jgi:hypothetical protein
MEDDKKLVSRKPTAFSGFKTSDGAIHYSFISAENAQRELDALENLRDVLRSDRQVSLSGDEEDRLAEHILSNGRKYMSILLAAKVLKKTERFIKNWIDDGEKAAPKVGSTITIKQSSSSPPAFWTEVWKVTRVLGSGEVIGTVDVPDYREYDGEDMR